MNKGRKSKIVGREERREYGYLEEVGEDKAKTMPREKMNKPTKTSQLSRQCN